MMNRKHLILTGALAGLMVLAATACAAPGNDGAPSADEPAQNQQTEAKTLTGMMDEMKDFMFVVLDDNQVPYAFDLAEDSDLDLSGIAAGDRVVVTYEGELSEVDPFEGTVISVEKAAE